MTREPTETEFIKETPSRAVDSARRGFSHELVRVRFDIAYDGTDFAGWAKQPGQRTVAGVVEEALATLFQAPVQLTVAGRTDAGVHAAGQVAHVDLNAALLSSRLPPGKLVRKLARMLPLDVRVMAARAVSAEFDARFSALRRHYRYSITRAVHGADPLRAREVVAWTRPLDLDVLRTASQSLVGLHNFAAFCRPRPCATTIRELQRFDWASEGLLLTAEISADAFCWSMARSLVGAVTAVAEGKRDMAWCRGLLDARSRVSDIPVAPAHGLSLLGVDYPHESAWGERNTQTRGLRVHVDPGR